jgi:hypothetical protein
MKAALPLMCAALALAGCRGVVLEPKNADGKRPSRQEMEECSRQAVRANLEAGDYVHERVHETTRPTSARQRRVVLRRQTKRWYDLVARCLAGKGYR